MRPFYKLLTIKRLFLSILILGGFPAIYFANYAMIFHWKAAIISLVGVGFSVYGLLLNHHATTIGENKSSKITKNGLLNRITNPVNSGEKYIWNGLAIYTLNFYWIALMLIMSKLVFKNRIVKVTTSGMNTSSSVDQKNTTSLQLSLSLLYLLYDSYREFTVWHEVRIRCIPFIAFVFFLMIFIYQKFAKKYFS